MKKELLRAARRGIWVEIESLYNGDLTVLDGRTVQGNTCLHIAALCGHEKFCSEVVRHKPYLLSVTNTDKETPILTAVKSSHAASLVPHLLQIYLQKHLSEDLLKQDRQGCNILHHAIRSGLSTLALTLIEKSPAALSYALNVNGESPIFMAVLRRDFKVVYQKLLEQLQGTDEKMYSGSHGSNALHAAVKYDEPDFVNQLVRGKKADLVRELATTPDRGHDTPMQLAAHYNRHEILETMLDFDQSLGYHVSERGGNPLLFTAANRGHVDFARSLLEYCPEAPYVDKWARTCLHEAVIHNRMEFVKFIINKDSKLWKLINMQDNDGNTALHLAVQRCNTDMVSALLRHPQIDINVSNTHNHAAIWKLNELDNYVKTINWNKISDLIFASDKRAQVDIYNLHEEIKNDVDSASRKNAKSISETYTGNTSLVAILIATVTFAAAFTLPGGYSSGAGSEGLAIMARKLAFQAFLIFDTLAMCCSLAVAFLCIKLRSMDFEFFLYYRYFTNKLMWFAYVATTLAFATGLYTVVAPRVFWLAITICVLSVSLPIIMVFLGEWPIWMLKLRRDKSFDSEFLDMA